MGVRAVSDAAWLAGRIREVETEAQRLRTVGRPERARVHDERAARLLLRYRAATGRDRPDAAVTDS